MTLEQLLQEKIDELEPYHPIDEADLEEIDPKWLAPIEGVSLDQWAAISAGVFVGATLDILLGDVGIERVRWQRACHAWNARLARDGSLVIASSLEAALRNVRRRLARGSIPPRCMK